MKDAIRRSTSHQLIERGRRAAQHEADVGRGKDDTFSFSGCARSVDNRNRIFIAHPWRIKRDASCASKYLVKQKIGRGSGPVLLNFIAQRRIATTDER